MDVAFMSATELKHMIDSKEASIIEIIEHLYNRIEKLNPTLNVFLALCREYAIEQAVIQQEALEKGVLKGKLAGIPISIKDLEMTSGIVTTLGSAVFKDRVPIYDSVVVERVKNEGAIILGKTNTPEFGQSGTTENNLGDACRNPWDTSRTAGGSSGGAGSGLAAGLFPLATGSDGGGSIRIPASFNGVFGIKPSQGRVPRYGGYGVPASNHLSQSGPMARTVTDCALLLQVMSGMDPRDPTSIRINSNDFLSDIEKGVSGWKIGWSSDLGYAAVDPEVQKVCEQSAKVFESLGANVEEVALGMEDPFHTFFDIFATGTYTSYGDLLEQHGDDLTDYVRSTLAYASTLSAADFSKALLEQERLKRRMEAFFDDYDLLLTPTMAVTAFEVNDRPTTISGKEVHKFWGYLPFTYPINITGQTAASVPCGFSSLGMPIGLHIVGPFGAESKVLRASRAFERAAPWDHNRPSIN
tara:strand:- start:8380 stop:9789 length:1410 start_codon:yes stop_codon:yes gene_type:complete